MKAILPLAVLVILISGCTFSPDYPSNRTYYGSSEAIKEAYPKVYAAPAIAVEEDETDFQDVCVGQWCQCGGG